MTQNINYTFNNSNFTENNTTTRAEKSGRLSYPTSPLKKACFLFSSFSKAKMHDAQSLIKFRTLSISLTVSQRNNVTKREDLRQNKDWA